MCPVVLESLSVEHRSEACLCFVNSSRKEHKGDGGCTYQDRILLGVVPRPAMKLTTQLREVLGAVQLVLNTGSLQIHLQQSVHEDIHPLEVGVILYVAWFSSHELHDSINNLKRTQNQMEKHTTCSSLPASTPTPN